MQEITLLYSSGWGNTKLVVDKISEVLQDAGYGCNYINAVTASTGDFLQTDTTILAAPTYDHGVLHRPYEQLLEQAEKIDLSWHRYAIVGLGDDKYDAEYNIESADILTRFVTEHNGELIGGWLLINKSPVDKLDDLIANWTADLIDKLNA